VCEKHPRRRKKKDDSLNLRCKSWDNRFTIFGSWTFWKHEKTLHYWIFAVVADYIPVLKVDKCIMSYQAMCKIVFSHFKVRYCCVMLVIVLHLNHLISSFTLLMYFTFVKWQNEEPNSQLHLFCTPVHKKKNITCMVCLLKTKWKGKIMSHVNNVLTV